MFNYRNMSIVVNTTLMDRAEKREREKKKKKTRRGRDEIKIEQNI